VVAPLAVCAGLKVPQDPAGEQLQSTPPFALSFETVAAIVAVAPATIVEGGAVVIAIDMADGVVDTVDDDETVPPQPEKNTVSSKTLATARIPHFDDTRIFSTVISSFIWTSNSTPGHRGRLRRRLVPQYYFSSATSLDGRESAEKINYETRSEDALNAVNQQSGDNLKVLRNCQ